MSFMFLPTHGKMTVTCFTIYGENVLYYFAIRGEKFALIFLPINRKICHFFKPIQLIITAVPFLTGYTYQV